MRAMDLRARVAGIGALADDTRRALYEYVVAQPDRWAATRRRPPSTWRGTT